MIILFYSCFGANWVKSSDIGEELNNLVCKYCSSAATNSLRAIGHFMAFLIFGSSSFLFANAAHMLPLIV